MWLREVKGSRVMWWLEHKGPRAHLLLAVFEHVLVLGQLLVLLGFDAFGFVPEPVGVFLLQPLDGLLLLPLQVLHLLVVLTLLTLRIRRIFELTSKVK